MCRCTVLALASPFLPTCRLVYAAQNQGGGQLRIIRERKNIGGWDVPIGRDQPMRPRVAYDLSDLAALIGQIRIDQVGRDQCPKASGSATCRTGDIFVADRIVKWTEPSVMPGIVKWIGPKPIVNESKYGSIDSLMLCEMDCNGLAEFVMGDNVLGGNSFDCVMHLEPPVFVYTRCTETHVQSFVLASLGTASQPFDQPWDRREQSKYSRCAT